MCIWRKSSNPSSCTGSSTAWRRASWPSRRPAPWSSRRATPRCWSRRSSRRQEKDYDFFPLTVDFIEKMYAVGRIPGGYLKREARPSDKGTLTARMVDRPIRPGFADGFKREVHVVCTTLVVDSVNPPDTICVMGASAALMLGAAPFDGPAACVRIGRDIETGEFIVNPTFEESEHSDLELTIAGTADYISMVEAGADEISEAGHAGRHDVRPGGHRRVLRGAAALPRPREHPAGRVARPRGRPGHRRARGPVHGRDVRRAARRRQAVAHGQGGRAQGRASRPSSSPTRSAPPGRATSPPSSRSSRRRPCARWSSRPASAPTAARPRRSARSTSSPATCPACTARACSSAARPRCCPW